MGFKTSSGETSPSAPAQVATSTDSKWLLASHLQKAIRRSLPDEAAWAASHLTIVDAAYLRYRLAVIAVEDVAGGTPEVVAEAFGAGWTKKAVEARGGASFLIDTARNLASAVKDRTPCNWMDCTRHIPTFEAQYGPWAELSLADARRLAFEASSWWARGLAAWRAVGTDRFPSGHLSAVAGDWPSWLALVAERGGNKVQQAALLAGASQREAHPVFLALAWDAQKAGSQVLTRTPLDLGKAGPWLSAAVDKHTREGLVALRRLTGTREGLAWGKAHGLTADALADTVGRLWFWVDGGEVAQARRYPLAAEIEQEVKQGLLSRTGISGADLISRWSADPAPMHAARCAAIGHSLSISAHHSRPRV